MDDKEADREADSDSVECETLAKGYALDMVKDLQGQFSSNANALSCRQLVIGQVASMLLVAGFRDVKRTRGEDAAKTWLKFIDCDSKFRIKTLLLAVGNI